MAEFSLDTIDGLSPNDVVPSVAEHDGLKALVNFFSGPTLSYAVLRHFKAGDRDTARVGCLARGVEN